MVYKFPYGKYNYVIYTESIFVSTEFKKYKDHTRSVEIRYKQNDETEETVLTKVQFAFDPKVSVSNKYACEIANLYV